MSNYVTNFRNMVNIFGYKRSEIESWFSSYNLEDYLTNEQISAIEEQGVWSKEKLASKIYEWYYMREIGLETPGLFEHYAKAKMSRIMEKYLPIIYSRTLNYNILDNKNITETVGKMGSETGTNQLSTINNSSSSASGLTINSDTPQGEVTKENILAGKYATSTIGSESTGTTNDSVASSSNGSLSKSESITRTISRKRRK